MPYAFALFAAQFLTFTHMYTYIYTNAYLFYVKLDCSPMGSNGSNGKRDVIVGRRSGVPEVCVRFIGG